MALDKAGDEQAKAALRRAKRHLQKSHRCTADDLACVNSAVNRFLDWYEENRPPIAEPAVACAKKAVEKIAQALSGGPKKGDGKA